MKNFSCHSLLKTFGRQVYNMNSDNSELALVKLMELFNHSSIAITKRYLGLRQEEILQTYDCLTFLFRLGRFFGDFLFIYGLLENLPNTYHLALNDILCECWSFEIFLRLLYSQTFKRSGVTYRESVFRKSLNENVVVF